MARASDPQQFIEACRKGKKYWVGRGKKTEKTHLSGHKLPLALPPRWVTLRTETHARCVRNHSFTSSWVPWIGIPNVRSDAASGSGRARGPGRRSWDLFCSWEREEIAYRSRLANRQVSSRESWASISKTHSRRERESSSPDGAELTRCQRRDTRNENNDPNCNRKQRRRQRQNFSVEFTELKVTQGKTADSLPPPLFFYCQAATSCFGIFKITRSQEE